MDHKKKIVKTRKHLSRFQIIIMGFAGVILLGALLLMLPISSSAGIVTPFNEALFTATSSVCVTGLIVRDTGSYWSTFGQIIIITLIQVGGLGVITMAIGYTKLSGKKVSLMQRTLMQESVSASHAGGIVSLTSFIFKMTIIFELAGAIIMMPVFVGDYGLKGIWMSIFHSISAFCNAGFDILGTPDAKFGSLTSYATNPVISIVIPLLIIIGGIGFITWEDIGKNKWHIKKYRLQTKVILLTSILIIFIPMILFMLSEYSDLPIGDNLLASFFQAVTPRTAGFNTTDLTKLSGVGRGVMIILMLIGGAPGSTAGGMKVTTFAVVLATSFAVFRHKKDTIFFKRRIDISVVRDACTILVMYLVLFIGGAMIISMVEGLPMGSCLFETASAVGTVGLTLGITPSLGIVSQIILILLMFFGRVGGLTIVYAAISRNRNSGKENLFKYPLEDVNVG